MNYFEGWFREKVLGWAVNKLVGLVPVEAPFYGGVTVNHGHYKVVDVHYMSDNELFSDFKKGKVEYHTENWTHQDKKVRYFYVNVRDGAQVMMDGGRAVTFSPDVLREMFDVSDIRGMSKAVLA